MGSHPLKQMISTDDDNLAVGMEQSGELTTGEFAGAPRTTIQSASEETDGANKAGGKGKAAGVAAGAAALKEALDSGGDDVPKEATRVEQKAEAGLPSLFPAGESAGDVLKEAARMEQANAQVKAESTPQTHVPMAADCPVSFTPKAKGSTTRAFKSANAKRGCCVLDKQVHTSCTRRHHAPPWIANPSLSLAHPLLQTSLNNLSSSRIWSFCTGTRIEQRHRRLHPLTRCLLLWCNL
jgi:hypothetical protein